MNYFAYGSNMDQEDLRRWCREKNHREIKFLYVVPAKLKDYKLVFNYSSLSRNGGAANIMESEGGIVCGLLMGLEIADLAKIRKKEGYCVCYKEIKVDVETFDGEKFKGVITYKVKQEKEESHHVKPTEEYLYSIIKNAIKHAFPKGYIDFLRSFECQSQADKAD